VDRPVTGVDHDDGIGPIGRYGRLRVRDDAVAARSRSQRVSASTLRSSPLRHRVCRSAPLLAQ
jgi:hypothetical protein